MMRLFNTLYRYPLDTTYFNIRAVPYACWSCSSAPLICIASSRGWSRRRCDDRSSRLLHFTIRRDWFTGIFGIEKRKWECRHRCGIIEVLVIRMGVWTATTTKYLSVPLIVLAQLGLPSTLADCWMRFRSKRSSPTIKHYARCTDKEKLIFIGTSSATLYYRYLLFPFSNRCHCNPFDSLFSWIPSATFVSCHT